MALATTLRSVHFVYLIYLAMCLLQPLVLVLLLAHGHHPSIIYAFGADDTSSINASSSHQSGSSSSNNNNIIIHNNINNNSNGSRSSSSSGPPTRIVVVAADLEVPVGLASGLAALWACLYLALVSADEDAGEVCAFLDDPDEDDVAPEEAHRALELARVVFWLCAGLQCAYLCGNGAALASPLRGDGDTIHDATMLEAAWYPAALHIGALLLLTRSLSPRRRTTVSARHVLGALAYILALQSSGLYALTLVPLDGVLVLAHTYNRAPSALIALNSRLFYLASSGALVLLRVALLSSSTGAMMSRE